MCSYRLDLQGLARGAGEPAAKQLAFVLAQLQVRGRAFELYSLPEGCQLRRAVDVHRADQRAYRQEGGRAGGFLDMTLVSDDRWRGLFDHWGTSHIAYRDRPDVPTLCTEPYAGRPHIEMALRFADWLGCDVEIGLASWWFPGSTVRIEFVPRPERPR